MLFFFIEFFINLESISGLPSLMLPMRLSTFACNMNCLITLVPFLGEFGNAGNAFLTVLFKVVLHLYDGYEVEGILPAFLLG